MKFKANKRGEEGIVAFMVVAVIATLLALITLGFSHLMSRELRQSLDRQLSDQAYYAAESGINDARNYLASGGSSSNGCAAPSDVSPTPFAANGNISGDNLVKYSCVVIDAQPKELIYNLKAGESIRFKLDLANLDKLYLSWENQAYNSSPQPLGSRGQLPRVDQLNTDATGLLRTAIYPVVNNCGGYSDTNSILNCASRNYFMYPDAGSGSAGTTDYRNSNNNGSFVDGSCNNTTHPNLPFAKSTPRYCNSAVTNLNGVARYYYVQLTAVYKPLSVSIQAADNSGSAQPIRNVEGIIDVTGTGNDVLQRLRARVPLQEGTASPAFSIQSMQAVCKGFRVPVTSQGVYGMPYLDSSIPNGDNTCSEPVNTGAIVGGGLPSLQGVPCPSPFTGNIPNCSCPSNSYDNNLGTCVCNPGFNGTPPGCQVNCPANAYNTSATSCACNSGYQGYPNCTPIPPPEACPSAPGTPCCKMYSYGWFFFNGDCSNAGWQQWKTWNNGCSGWGELWATNANYTTPQAWIHQDVSTNCSPPATSPPPPPAGGGSTGGGGTGGGGGGCGLNTSQPTMFTFGFSMFYFGRVILC